MIHLKVFLRKISYPQMIVCYLNEIRIEEATPKIFARDYSDEEVVTFLTLKMSDRILFIQMTYNRF